MPKPVKLTCIAILEVMWDWRSMTSDAGYKRIAPRLYTINPDNFTGRRLYNWMGNKFNLRVTNACKELVGSASEKGTPDKEWLATSLESVDRLDLLLVCGRVAQDTFESIPDKRRLEFTAKLGMPRTVYCPHPAARNWNTQTLEEIKLVIHDKSVVFASTYIRDKQLQFNHYIVSG